MSRLQRVTPPELEGKNANAPVATAAFIEEIGEFDCFYFYSFFGKPELFECYLNLPTMTQNVPSPLDLDWMQQQQQ